MHMAEIRKWSKIEEKVLMKKSMINWITSRDVNIKYFHAQMNIRSNRNTITSIHNANGVKLYEPKLVEEEFISCFTKLMRTTSEDLPCSNVELTRNGSCLSYQQRCVLIAPITD